MYRFKTSLIAVFALIALMSFAGPVQALDIFVGPGTYTEDIVVPADKPGLNFIGAPGAIIQGVAIGLEGGFPLAAPNIEILGAGTKFHGFTIKAPVFVAGNYSSGIVIGAQNVEIYDNQIQCWAGEASSGEIGQAIQTYQETAVPGVNVSGLNIHNNTFTHLNAGAWGYEAIYINRDMAGGATVTVENNTFNGNVLRAITVERSEAIVTGNVITTALARAGAGLATAGGYEGISIRDAGSGGPVTQDNVSVTNNIVRGLVPADDGFLQGIRIGLTGQTFTNITVTGNTVDDNTVGVLIRVSTAMGITFTGNNIGNNNGIGVQNDDTVNAFLADGNYWISYAGPGVSDGFRTGATTGGDGAVTVDSWSMGEFGVDVGETTPDGINNDSDPDDDNDTFSDLQELAAGTDQLSAGSVPPAITAISIDDSWVGVAIGTDVNPYDVTGIAGAPITGKIGFDCFGTFADALAAAPTP